MKNKLILIILVIVIIGGLYIFTTNESKTIEPLSSSDTLTSEAVGLDIYQVIENKYPDDSNKQNILKNLATQLESILDVEKLEDVDIDSFLHAVDCTSFNTGGLGDIVLVESLVFDTDEKREKYEDFNAYQSGKFFGGESGVDLDCNFD